MNKLTITIALLLLISCNKKNTSENNNVDVTQTIKIGDKINLKSYNLPSLNIPPKIDSKIIVLDFWATWCGPCIASFPHLKKLKKKYSEDIEIIAVSIESEETIKKFLSKKNYNFSFVQDKKRGLNQKFDISSLPVTAIISNDNTLLWAGRSDNNEFEKILLSAIKTNNIDEDLVDTKKLSPSISKYYHQNESKIEYREKLLEYSIERSNKNEIYSSPGNWINSDGLVDLEFVATPLIILLEDITGVGRREMIYDRKDIDTISLNLIAKSKSQNITNRKIANTIFKDIKELFNLEITRKTRNVNGFELQIKDLIKLKKAEETSKGGGAGKFEGGKYIATRFSIEQLAHILEKRSSNHYYFSSLISSDKKYNFVLDEVCFDNVNVLKKQLFNKYGIELKSKPKKINFLIIK